MIEKQTFSCTSHLPLIRIQTQLKTARVKPQGTQNHNGLLEAKL